VLTDALAAVAYRAIAARLNRHSDFDDWMAVRAGAAPSREGAGRLTGRVTAPYL
jgi:hypothetical protein